MKGLASYLDLFTCAPSSTVQERVAALPFLYTVLTVLLETQFLTSPFLGGQRHCVEIQSLKLEADQDLQGQKYKLLYASPVPSSVVLQPHSHSLQVFIIMLSV